MDAVEIRRQYPKLILWGGIDERAVLAAGTPDDVRREVERVANGVGRGYDCSFYVGQENLLAMLHEAPDLIEYLQDRLLERIIEEITAYANG